MHFNFFFHFTQYYTISDGVSSEKKSTLVCYPRNSLRPTSYVFYIDHLHLQKKNHKPFWLNHLSTPTVKMLWKNQKKKLHSTLS